MTTHFDLCVLGSGAVGQTVAYGGRKAGLSVAVIETQAPGGTCPNRGCDAKKPYVNAAGLMYRSNLLAAAGGGIAPATLDWATIAAFKKSFTDPVGDLTAADLRKAGVELIAGQPAFTGPGTAVVGEQTITADRFVIATGLLHLVGIAFGLLIRWPSGVYAIQAGGAAISLVGLAFLVGLV